MFGKTKKPQSIETTLRIVNSRDKEITFVLEPWTPQTLMPPGAAFEIVVSGPAGGNLEVEYLEDNIVVYGWVGSTVTVFHQGTKVLEGTFPVPPVPPQMSVRDFVLFMFFNQGKDSQT